MLIANRTPKKYLVDEKTKIGTSLGGLYRGLDLELQRTVAVKHVNVSGENLKVQMKNYQNALTEVQAMIRLSEENDISIPKVYDAVSGDDPANLYIVMEWINGQDFSKFRNTSEIKFLNWMMDLVEILSVMEKQKIYHKDIKPSNIMITSNEKLYLIDFNISISSPNQHEGTPHYKAPEMDVMSKYQGREKVDMFSLGVIMYEYYTKKLPIRTMEYGKKRQRGEFSWDYFTEPKEFFPELDMDMNGFITRCMRLNPRERFINYSSMKYELGKVVKAIQWNQRRK